MTLDLLQVTLDIPQLTTGLLQVTLDLPQVNMDLPQGEWQALGKWTYLKASGKQLVNALSKALILNGAIFYFSQEQVYILAAQSQLMALQTRFQVLPQVGLAVVFEPRLAEVHCHVAQHIFNLYVRLLLDRQDSSVAMIDCDVLQSSQMLC